MGIKVINARALAIQGRFFTALEQLQGERGLKGFCADNHLNRIKYSRIKNAGTNANVPYKLIDIDALAALCDLGVSPSWLLLGRGEMMETPIN